MPRSSGSPADAALARVRSICMAFPATEEKLSRGAPVFHVRGKLFVMFLDHHHDDDRVAVWCKSTHEEQRRLVAEDPNHYFVPPYVGVSGWVGVQLNRPNVDWIALAMIAEGGWSAVAPPAVREGRWKPSKPPPPPPKRLTTDAKVARDALARVRAICDELPNVELEKEGEHATLRAGSGKTKKVFAYFLDNHHGDGVIALGVKTSKAEAAALAKKDPEHFYLPQYIGARGYVGLKLSAQKVDWKDVAARLKKSHAEVTSKPKKA